MWNKKWFLLISIVGFSILMLFYVNNPLSHQQVPLFSHQIFINNSSYIINTSKCKILNLHPFDPRGLEFYFKEKYSSCSDKPLLTYVESNGSRKILHVNSNVISEYTDGNLHCCYSKIIRSTPIISSGLEDLSHELLPCINFNDSVTLDHDSIEVQCEGKDTGETIYKNTHAQITINKKVEKKYNLIKNKNAFSVIILGIDSVSRLNFIRSLPKSYEFLMENGWISFRGYNKVADNTYPNVIALMTGLNLSYSNHLCMPTTWGGLDKCPLIWYDYRKLGYVTAYVEDECWISTFNLDKKGFRDPPTDYYFRPYLLASEQDLKIRKRQELNYCTGPEVTGERILNLAKDFAFTFNKGSFGLFWMNSFSHNRFNTVSAMDDKIKQFLQDISINEILDNSFIVFLSDHGLRIGNFRTSSMGWYEERLPFFFLWVPHKFRHKYPNEYLNIKENAHHKLTNPYDLYMTLQHILVLSKFNYKIVPSSACPKCKSLFEKIEDRSCEDAGIERHWCTCTLFTPMEKNNTLVTNATLYVIDQIHQIINSSDGFSMCAHFSLKTIIAGSISTVFSINEQNYTLIAFETIPNATFEATLVYKQSKTMQFEIIGQISRLDTYKDTSACASQSLKKFCYCKNML